MLNPNYNLSNFLLIFKLSLKRTDWFLGTDLLTNELRIQNNELYSRNLQGSIISLEMNRIIIYSNDGCYSSPNVFNGSGYNIRKHYAA